MPETDPFRLRVQKKVCDQIKTVTPDNGYNHDLSDYLDEDDATITKERVFRGVERFDDEIHPRPMVAVIEHPRNTDLLLSGSGGGDSVGKYQLMVQGFVVDNDLHPTDAAHKLCAEVVQALVKARVQYDMFGMGDREPMIETFAIGQPVVRQAVHDDQVVIDCAWFAFPLTLTLIEDLENPFA